MSAPLSVPEIQQEAERVLGVFHDFCEAHGLRYFAAYGTLLGAIRHHGPIPWDDDVDVLMPRPDYDRLLRMYADTDHDTKLFVPGSGGDYPIHFAKLVSRRTAMVESSVHFPEDYGVFVDVFPLDGLPARGAARHLRYADVLHRIFQASYHQKLPEGPLPLQAQLRRAVGALGRVVPRKTYLRMIDRAMRKYPYEQADRVAMLLSYLPLETEAFDKGELEGSALVPYGELQIRTFAKPEPVLLRNYGADWRTPIQRPEASHGVATWRE